jgi:hypothetical protein
MLTFIAAHSAALLAIGWGTSEILAEIPAVKSNSVFQLLTGWIRERYKGSQG